MPWEQPAPDQSGHALQSDQTQAWAPGRLLDIAQTAPVQLWPLQVIFWGMSHITSKNIKQMENPSPEIFLKAKTLAHYSFYTKSSSGLQKIPTNQHRAKTPHHACSPPQVFPSYPRAHGCPWEVKHVLCFFGKTRHQGIYEKEKMHFKVIWKNLATHQWPLLQSLVLGQPCSGHWRLCSCSRFLVLCGQKVGCCSWQHTGAATAALGCPAWLAFPIAAAPALQKGSSEWYIG